MSNMLKKVRRKLDINTEELLASKTITIGTQEVPIKQLKLVELALVVSKVKGVAKEITAEGVNASNYNTPESMVTIINSIMSQAPEVLSIASDIDQETIDSLPIENIVDILNAIIEVNVLGDRIAASFSNLSQKFTDFTGKDEKGK